MAIYHLSAQIIGRSAGRSVTAAAAYRAHEKIMDERTGITHDYTRRRGDFESFIMAPDHAPDWVHDRAHLWNEVEKTEKRKDAQLARELNVALPIELTPEQQKTLLSEFVQNNMVSRGMIADVAIHRDHQENPHAHILLTMRDISADGFGNKNREWNPDFGFGKVQNAEKYVDWREAWANLTNEHLSFYRHEARIDHRTLEAQGIDRLPTIHEGPAVRQMEAKGIPTERGEHNRMVQEHAQIVAEQKHNVVDFEEYRHQREELIKEIENRKPEPIHPDEPPPAQPESSKPHTADELMDMRISAEKNRSDLEHDRIKHHDLLETRRLIALNQSKLDEAKERLRQIDERGWVAKLFNPMEKERREAERDIRAETNEIDRLEKKLPPPREAARLEEIAPNINGLMNHLNKLIDGYDGEMRELQPSRKQRQKKGHEQERGMSR